MPPADMCCCTASSQAISNLGAKGRSRPALDIPDGKCVTKCKLIWEGYFGLYLHQVMEQESSQMEPSSVDEVRSAVSGPNNGQKFPRFPYYRMSKRANRQRDVAPQHSAIRAVGVMD